MSATMTEGRCASIFDGNFRIVDLSKVKMQKDLRRNPAALRGFLEGAQPIFSGVSRQTGYRETWTPGFARGCGSSKNRIDSRNDVASYDVVVINID
jgi:hypothetical protein